MQKQKSRRRHALAALRKALSLTQKEMAAVADCATITVYSIETGKLALSKRLAEHIAKVTGVSREWLLAGDPKAPMVAEDGKPYNPKYFEDRQARLFQPDRTKRQVAYEYDALPEVLGFGLFKIYAILRRGYLEDRFAWTSYKLHTGLDLLADELGVDTGLAEHINEMDLKGHGGEKLIDAVKFIARMHNEAFAKQAEGAKKEAKPE